MNLLCRFVGFAAKQAEDLCFGPCAVLRQSFDHMTLIIK